MKYHFDYNSFDWKLKSYQIKKRDNFECQICGSTSNLHVHHIVYDETKKICDYPGNYLITLCNHCHIAEHAALEVIGNSYKEQLLSGMLAIDIYRKLKNKESIIN